MANLLVNISMSLDCFVAGSNDGVSRPLGEEGECLYDWSYGGEWTYDQLATTAAAGRDVMVIGGPDLIRQYLDAGLVDEMHLHIVPVLLGAGRCGRRSDRIG